MKGILAKTVSDHHREWDSHLSFALAAFHATRHDSTGYTPNFLMLGREVRAPSDIVNGNPLTLKASRQKGGLCQFPLTTVVVKWKVWRTVIVSPSLMI